MSKSFLKYINSLPVKFTMKHYQVFGYSGSMFKDGELNSADSWDVLRETHPQFSISKNRKEWLRACDAQIKKDGQDGGLLKRAEEINALLKREGITHVFSVGVGGAGLEYQLKKLNPSLRLVCSEFAPQNVALLKGVFEEADDIVQFDILKGDWNDVKNKYLPKNSICLMYRVDVSFSDEQWRQIFQRMHDAGIETILYIPSTMLTILSICNRKWRELKWSRSKSKIIFSGYLRTKKRFQSFWKGLYVATPYEFGGIKSFLHKIQ
jgi:hypothetical protein